MRRVYKLLWLTFVLIFTAVPVVSARSAEPPADGEGVLVGRVAFVEGQLLRYVPDEKDWVAAVKDAPFGLDDALYSDEQGKAEFIMPNNTSVRIGGDTQVQLITLNQDVTEVDFASGIARLFNKSRSGVIKATTPFGYVVAPAGSTFDLYVGDKSVEVIALQGNVSFVHEGDEGKYDVNAGSSSVVADSREVTSGEGNVDADWDDWNVGRDQFWAKRVQVKGESVRYLPEGLHNDAADLDQHGRWERVYYDGSYRTFWRPVGVTAGWAPFTAGRWTVYYEDNCWIPDEPFGYVTHHYGNWVYVNSGWYWAPPVVTVGVAVGPALGIGFGWYPGRVSWVSSGAYVGWVPLAPYEPYYSYHHWGPRSVVVNNININRISINVNRYAYINHAVVVNQTNFYGVNDYRSVRVTNINRTTIINNYRPAPVINNTVINNYTNNKQRYAFNTNATVINRPHESVVNRIDRNQKISRELVNVNAKSIERNVSTIKAGRIAPAAQIQRPVVTNKLVPANEVNRPASELKFQQKELKRNVRPQTEVEQRLQKSPEGRPGGLDINKPGQLDQPRQPGMPGEGQGRVRPPRPGQQDLQPTEPGQPGMPGEGKGRVRPPRPGQQDLQPTEPGQPGAGKGRVRPPRPGQDLQQPGEVNQPGAPGEGKGRVRPPRPGQQDLQQPGESGQPGAPGERQRRVRPPRPGQEQLQPGGSDPSAMPGDARRRTRPQRPDQDVQSGSPRDMGGAGAVDRSRRARPPREQLQPEGMGQQQMMDSPRRQRPARQVSPDQMGGGPRQPREQMIEQRRQVPPRDQVQQGPPARQQGQQGPTGEARGHRQPKQDPNNGGQQPGPFGQ